MANLKKKGFTLIELIVVMAVIGVLVLLAAPKFMGYTKEAKFTKLIADTKQLETASERYYMDHEQWPRLSDTPYTSLQIEEFAQKIYDTTGKTVELDPSGNYYDIDYEKLSKYIKIPDNKEHYIIQNPIGNVYGLEGLTEEAINRFDNKPRAVITKNVSFIDTLTNIVWSHSESTDPNENEIVATEWQLDSNPVVTTAPNGVIGTAGEHRIKLRVMNDKNIWSEWKEVIFTVNEYVAPVSYTMNTPNSAIINTVNNYKINDTLIFNYTNNNNLNWTVPVSGVYSFDIVGAQGGGNGGKGARIQANITLTAGQVVNLKIHQQGNGGGNGGAGGPWQSNSVGHTGSSGGGGTIVKVDGAMILAAGGGGGSGASGGGGSGIYYPGSGGAGGNAGNTTGLAGGNGTNSRGNSNRIGGTGGANTSVGGNGGGGDSYGYTGNNGATLYDGGGGGGSGSYTLYYPSAGGGGGAGGKSYISETVTNGIVTPSFNTGHASVVLKLINILE